MRTMAKKHKILGAVLLVGFLVFSSAAAAHGGWHSGGGWMPVHQVCGY